MDLTSRGDQGSHSRSNDASGARRRQAVEGEISKRLQPIKEGLVEMIVHFESSVEFVEDDLDPLNINLFLSRIDQFIERLGALASSYRFGKLIRSGIKLALIGRPES